MFQISRSLCVAMVFTLGLGASASAQTPDEIAKVREAIWTKEQAIYANRASGSLDYYIQNTSPNYVGWPPSAPRPVPLTGLKQDSKAMAGQTKEKLTMELTDFTLSGGTAVIYYLNHRTVKPDGTPVDQRFENIHVWTREGADWHLIGAMSRLQPQR